MSSGSKKSVSAPVNLRCEYTVNPVGVDAASPRFSWVLQSSERAVTQKAYQIIVSDSKSGIASGRGNKWDSGRSELGRQANISSIGSGSFCPGRYCNNF